MRALVLTVVLALGWTSTAQAETVVSLTFDDTLGDQYDVVRGLLRAHGAHATFYVNSGRIDGPRYMSLTELHTLEADGNEIGGHTVNHVVLPTLPVDEQRRQICNDRANLLELGFRVTNFAYPLSAETDALEGIVRECGYVSARVVGGLSCATCDAAESRRPANPWRIRTPSSIVPTTTLDELERYVTAAEAAGGGWVPLVFHHACEGCNPLSVSPAMLETFLSWLAARKERGTVVRTVGEMIGGDLAPPVRAPMATPIAPGQNALVNPSFEDASFASDNDLASCWRGGKGAENVRTVRDARTGRYAIAIDMFPSDEASPRLVSAQDMGACSPAAAAGRTYGVRVFTKATAQPRLVAYVRTSLGGWKYWAKSEPLPASDDWHEQSWSTPSLPAGTDGIGIGIELTAPGHLVVDDASLTDATPPPASGCAIAARTGEGVATTVWAAFALALGGGISVRLSARSSRRRRRMPTR